MAGANSNGRKTNRGFPPFRILSRAHAGLLKVAITFDQTSLSRQLRRWINKAEPNAKFVVSDLNVVAPDWESQYGRETIHKNWNLLKKNFSGILTALELAYGRSNGVVKHQNCHLLCTKMHIVAYFLRNGHKGIKEWCHRKRILAMHEGCKSQYNNLAQRDKGFGRGVTTRALFLASTLARGVSIRRTEEDIIEEEGKVLNRLTETKKRMSRHTMRLVKRYISRVAKKVKLPDIVRRRSIYPTPSVAACYSTSRGAGGVAMSGRLDHVSADQELMNQFKWYANAQRYIKVQIKFFHDRRKQLFADPLSGVDGSMYDTYPASGEFPGRELNPDGAPDWFIPGGPDDPQGMTMYDEAAVYLEYINYANILLDIVIRAKIKRKEVIKARNNGSKVQIPKFDPLNWGPPLLIRISGPGLTPVTHKLHEALGRIDTRLSQTPQDVTEVALQRLFDTKEPLPCKVKVIPEFQGKLRSVTIHRAELVQVARAINGMVLPLLQNLGTNQDLLKGNNITVTYRQYGNSQLPIAYSADLSKATDEMNGPDTRELLEHVLECAGAPVRYIQAAKYLTDPTLITEIDGKKLLKPLLTTAGALMGLGPSWTILSLLNNWAATSAGFAPHQFRTCGDDLVAIGKPSTCDKYEQNLRKVRLVPNTEKSFRGDNAVFCEMHCTRSTADIKKITPEGTLIKGTKHILSGVKEVRIAQAAGTRLLAGGQRTAMAAIAQSDELVNISLNKMAHGYHRPHPSIARLARTTANSIAIGQGGPLALGGGGRGKINRTTFNMALKHGVFKTTLKKRTATLEEKIEEVRNLPATDRTPFSGPTIDRKALIVEVTTAQSMVDQSTGQWRKSSTMKSNKVRASWNARYRSSERESPYRLLRQKIAELTRDNHITFRQGIVLTRRVNSYLRRGNYARAIKAYMNRPDFIKAQVADDIIQEIPMPIGIVGASVDKFHRKLLEQRLGIAW